MNATEKEEFIQEVLERVFRILPETIGNLMKSHALYQKLTEDFYKDHQEFKSHTDIVREVVGKLEGANPTGDYADILKEAIPEIKRQINLKGGVNTKIPTKESLDLTPSDNGAI